MKTICYHAKSAPAPATCHYSLATTEKPNAGELPLPAPEILDANFASCRHFPIKCGAVGIERKLRRTQG